MSRFCLRSGLGYATPYPRAILTCHSCHHRFSNLTERCPNCGLLLKLEPRRLATRFALVGTLILLGVLLIIGGFVLLSHDLFRSWVIVTPLKWGIGVVVLRVLFLVSRLRRIVKG